MSFREKVDRARIELFLARLGERFRRPGRFMKIVMNTSNATANSTRCTSIFTARR